jgi:hypothetical protein
MTSPQIRELAQTIYEDVTFGEGDSFVARDLPVSNTAPQTFDGAKLTAASRCTLVERCLTSPVLRNLLNETDARAIRQCAFGDVSDVEAMRAAVAFARLVESLEHNVRAYAPRATVHTVDELVRDIPVSTDAAAHALHELAERAHTLDACFPASIQRLLRRCAKRRLTFRELRR